MRLASYGGHCRYWRLIAQRRSILCRDVPVLADVCCQRTHTPVAQLGLPAEQVAGRGAGETEVGDELEQLLRVRERDCPAAVGRHDHVAEVTFTGTAIVRFSPARHPPGGPAAAIMPLGSQHRQGRL